MSELTAAQELEKAREVTNCPQGVELQEHLKQLVAENLTMKQIIDSVTNLDNEPQYHYEGMGCGLEDRGIADRYDACRYGWDEAMERVYAEVIPCAEEIESPATDSILREAEARGVEKFVVKTTHQFFSPENNAAQGLAYLACANKFVKQLREGKAE